MPRDGAFQDADGYIVTANGYQLSPRHYDPIGCNGGGYRDGRNGLVQTPSGVQVVGTIEIVSFPNPAGLAAEGDNLYRETEASGTAVSGRAVKKDMEQSCLSIWKSQTWRWFRNL